MPTKGMRSVLFHGSTTPPPPPPPSNPSCNDQVLDSTLVSGILSKAEVLVTKWDPRGLDFSEVASLFHENRDEASLFLRAVLDLHHGMHHLMTATVASPPTNSARFDLVRAHRLMEIAMKRLQKEFFKIISVSYDGLDSVYDVDDNNSVASSEEGEIRFVGETLWTVGRLPSIAMADLKAIAVCMVSTGYGKECVKIYTTIRKSIVDEGIYRLRFERLSRSQIQKLDPESVEQLIKNWLTAAIFVFKTLFSGERTLCDYIFGTTSTCIKERCFAEITGEAAVRFLEFPEIMAADATTKKKKKKRTSKHKSKSRTAEKLKHLMDLHDAIIDLWPMIEKVFSYDATSSVQSQAISSVQKLGESVRSILAEYELSIQKDSTKASKSPDVPGGGLHPLTSQVMNDLVLLADYGPTLDDIFVDHPLPFTLPNVNPCSTSSSASSSPARFAWLALVLLCKLDGKAELYKDVAISYLFLANNFHYILSRVINTPNLFRLLGEKWVRKHDEKVRWFTKRYVRLGWAKVEAAVEEGKVGDFNTAFEEACETQSEWVVVDERMKEEVVRLVRSKVVVPYRAWYERTRSGLVTAALSDGDDMHRPEYVERCLKDHLFQGSAEPPGSSSGSPSRSSFCRDGK